jgi:hypothetical protein
VGADEVGVAADLHRHHLPHLPRASRVVPGGG